MRASWDEVAELIAAAHVHTIRRYGPDRIAGFSPIPAMSMVSYAAGTRFLSLIGGVCLSFYDWYADLPPASPQIWGDQTDVPESADWWNSSYLILWGSNIPQTRTPDAHFMTEARYRGQKVVVVSPDYAGHTKFADHWLPAAGRHRRRARDGDGPRDPEGVLRRAAGALLRATTRASTPTCRSSSRCASATAPTSPTASCAPPTSARPARTPSGRRSSSTSDRRARRPQRLDRLPLGRGGRGEVEPRARRDRAGAHAARRATTSSSRSTLPRFDIGDTESGGSTCAAACPRSGSAASSSRPSSTCSAAQLGVAPRRAARRLAGRLRRPASPTRRPGRRSTPASTPAA